MLFKMKSVLSSHRTFLASKKRQVPSRLKASGLAPHLVELLAKHAAKSKVVFAKAQAQVSQHPEKKPAIIKTAKQKGEALKKATTDKFVKKKTSLMDSIRGFSKKELADVKKRKLKDRVRAVTSLTQIRGFDKSSMRRAGSRVLKAAPKKKRTVFSDIKAGVKLRKRGFRKAPTRKEHLQKLGSDRAYYKANFDWRRKRFAKK